MGLYAVILHTEESELQLQGPCNCSSQCISLYRSELMGILAVYYLPHSFISFSDKQTELSMPLYCNNISAVCSSNRNQLRSVTAYLVADYDILSEIRAYPSRGINIKAEWVKAHQDDASLLDDLPLSAQLNCMVDNNALLFMKNYSIDLKPTTTPILFPTTTTNLAVQGSVVTSNSLDLLLE
eukprot:402943-Ditylum_brightwellii.AAC.1